MPLGGFAGRPELMAHLRRDPPLSHVTTFGGHPVCSAAGLAALEVLLAEELPARAARLGEELRGCLRELGDRHGGIREVRGLGLLIGVEFESASLTERFVRAALDRGVVLGWTLHSDTVVRLAPPLNITAEELAVAMAAVEEALAAVLAS